MSSSETAEQGFASVSLVDEKQSSRHTRRFGKGRFSKESVTILVLALALLLGTIYSLNIGQMEVSASNSLSILAYKFFGVDIFDHTEIQASVLWSIRFPRVCLALLVGASLALSGCAMQGVFRNPLADPGLIGVSAGAAVAVAIAMVFAPAIIAIHSLVLPLVALGGGLCVSIIVWNASTRNGRTSTLTMLLMGIALTSLCGAGVGLCIYAADDNQLRDISFWMLGSLSAASWSSVGLLLPFFLLTILTLIPLSRGLDAMLLGEREASYLGISVQSVRKKAVFVAAAAVGSAVSVSGMIGFVGLVIPHIIRIILGPSHRSLLPVSALAGALALLIADMLARSLVPPNDLPIGILTALLGSPVFIWLLYRRELHA